MFKISIFHQKICDKNFTEKSIEKVFLKNHHIKNREKNKNEFFHESLGNTRYNYTADSKIIIILKTLNTETFFFFNVTKREQVDDKTQKSRSKEKKAFCI